MLKCRTMIWNETRINRHHVKLCGCHHFLPGSAAVSKKQNGLAGFLFYMTKTSTAQQFL